MFYLYTLAHLDIPDAFYTGTGIAAFLLFGIDFTVAGRKTQHVIQELAIKTAIYIETAIENHRAVAEPNGERERKGEYIIKRLFQMSFEN